MQAQDRPLLPNAPTLRIAGEGAPPPPCVDGEVVAGTHVATIERRHGTLSCHEQVAAVEIRTRSGDLAVADREAYLAACADHRQWVVITDAHGWHHVVRLDRELVPARILAMDGIGVRIASIVDTRGITPVLAA